MKMKVTPADLQAIRQVMDEAVESVCSCGAGGRGAGMYGHHRSCWVHIGRAKYQQVERFLVRHKGAPRANVVSSLKAAKK